MPIKNTLKKYIFREYDIRGLMDIEIDFSFVSVLGYVLSMYYKELGHSRVLLGYDTRRNSKAYHDILCEVLNRNGLDVISLGMIPSPCLYFAVHHLQIFAGIVVTASHNDAPYNGFKIWEGKSTLYGDAIHDIYLQMLKFYEKDKENLVSPHVFCQQEVCEDNKKSESFGITSFFDIKTPYARILHEQTGELAYKIVVDGANGAAGELCCDVLQNMGVEVIALYCEPKSDFPNHPPDPTILENCKDLREMILSRGADYGIALDGDGDRVVMLDRNGRMLFSDELLSLLARDMLLRVPKARILADVKCSHHIFKEIEDLGGIALIAPTGHSLMKASMQKERAHIGGELSGHFFHAENWFGTDDGILTSVRVLGILQKRNWDLTQFPFWAKSYASPEIRFDCPEHKKEALIKKAQSYYEEKYADSYKVTCIDGVRVDFGSSWFLVRASHTSANLTLRFEAETQAALDTLKEKTLQQITEWINEL